MIFMPHDQTIPKIYYGNNQISLVNNRLRDFTKSHKLMLTVNTNMANASKYRSIDKLEVRGQTAI